jgi:predicted phage-related endonuclease
MSLTKQQLVARKKGLFGTDASMLDGTNAYHDIFWLYKTKRGEWCDILEPAIHLELGHELEDYVARGYCKRKKKRVRRDNLTRWNKKHLYDGKPFIGSHVDRMVIGEKKILECKTIELPFTNQTLLSGAWASQGRLSCVVSSLSTVFGNTLIRFLINGTGCSP